MAKDCNSIRNELRILHDGTAQDGRQPLALSPEYARLDERTNADWIVFARSYSRFLQYHNVQDIPDGDWRAFWEKNPAIVLANLGAARVEWFREETQLIFFELQKLDNQGNALLLQQNFNHLYNAVATLALQLDLHVRQLPDELAVKTSLRNLITTKLAPAFRSWIGWHKQAALAGPAPFPLIVSGNSELLQRVSGMRILGEAIVPATDVYNTHSFSPDWITDASTDWATFAGNILPDAGIYGGAATVAGHINFAIRHFFFTNVFGQFLKGFTKAVQEAGVALQQLLSSWDRHEPHFALYLAFLRLFTEQQAALNTLTERHLNFYYKQVLRLKEKPPVPARAHVLIELAKHVQVHQLKKGALLKAGKDALGKEVFFALDEDVVFNKARVAELRCIFKAPNNPAEYQFAPGLPAYRAVDAGRYYAAPIANSEDGMGAELTSADKQWHPFGNKKKDGTGQFWEVQIPRAEIGFAIASHYLFLQEGERTITLSFNGVSGGSLNGKKFLVSLTTEKGWYEEEVTVSSNQLALTLPADAPAAIPYQVKLHEGAFSTSFPLLKALLVNDPAAAYPYQEIKNTTLSSITLTVEVAGKKSLALSGPTGPLDASKPFHPFGAAPSHGAAFVLGDKEVFQKQAHVRLHIEWKESHSGSWYDPHTYGSHPYTYAQALKKGEWLDIGTAGLYEAGDVLPHSATARTFSFSIEPDNRISPDFSSNSLYRTEDPAGFVRLKLFGDFGHSTHALQFAKYIAELSGATDPGRLLDHQILSLSLDYDASVTIPLNNSVQYKSQPGRLLHLAPFGFMEAAPDGASTRLFPLAVPQKLIQQGDETINNVGKDGGEWYIGLEGLAPPQVTALLIQVADGSADPLVKKPKNHLEFAFLRQNQWASFQPEEVQDGTNGLLQSGLLSLSIPGEASSDNTLLPPGLHWVRISVQSTADAVCQVIGVHAQASQATLVGKDNDPQLNALPLPEGTITKLLNPESAVKKITQPYATFGGQAAEPPGHFYTRASERLRHKNRAITLWDYERMVLEAFPSIHKVKCLNHLRYEQSGSTRIYRELAPGHVTVIAISNLRNRNAVDPLRPYTSLGELGKIHDFLQQHLSCFVKLHVRNPIFEPILADFSVRFFPGYDESFYTNLLNEEIKRFLSPWAFEEGEDISLGGKVYKSALINFIEEQPYIDYVEDFKLIHQINPPQPDQEAIEASTLCSILVSAGQHKINPIKGVESSALGEDCGCSQQTTEK